MGQSELFGLQWEHVNLGDAFVSVVQALVEGDSGLKLSAPKTRSSVRRVDIPEIAVRALGAHKSATQRESGSVFLSSDGSPIRKSNFLRRVFKPLLDVARVPAIRFHALRHTANTLLISSGIGPNVVAERMGHSSTRMSLDTYGHVLGGSQRAAADKLDVLFASDGGQVVVKEATIAPPLANRKTRAATNDADFQLVEMRRLELLTPYMRSKCSTS